MVLCTHRGTMHYARIVAPWHYMHARIMALWRCMGLCTWNYGRGEGEAMRARLLTVFSPFEHGSGLVFTLFACPRTENGCNSNLKFCLRVHKEREVDMHSALGIGMAQSTQCKVHTMHSAHNAQCTQGWVAFLGILLAGCKHQAKICIWHRWT